MEREKNQNKSIICVVPLNVPGEMNCSPHGLTHAPTSETLSHFQTVNFVRFAHRCLAQHTECMYTKIRSHAINHGPDPHLKGSENDFFHRRFSLPFCHTLCSPDDCVPAKVKVIQRHAIASTPNTHMHIHAGQMPAATKKNGVCMKLEQNRKRRERTLGCFMVAVMSFVQEEC